MQTVGRHSGMKLRPVKSLLHALDVLECLGGDEPELGVTDLAKRTGLSKTSVYQILGTLEARGCIIQSPVTARYRLGWRLYELGTAVVRRANLVTAAQPHLAQLVRDTGESVQLGVAAGTDVLYVARQEPPRSVVIAAQVGRRLPMHATAAGKVLLAWLSPEHIAEVLAGALVRYTPQTIVEPEVLRGELQRVRQQGWADCYTEYENDVNATAAPIFNFSGQVVAVISLAGPSTRFDRKAMRETRDFLVATARSVSQELGFNHSDKQARWQEDAAGQVRE